LCTGAHNAESRAERLPYPAPATQLGIYFANATPPLTTADSRYGGFSND
jgi:hypothetical protein